MDVDNAPNRLRSLPSWLLGQAAIEGRRVVGDVLAGEGLHRSQYALMASLEEFGPLSQTALSERSGLDRSDVVRWVDGLAARGLVQRTRDARDRRRNTISITREGRRRLQELDAQLDRAQHDLLGTLSDEERKLLILLLGRLLGLQRQPE
jgi:MarR family transcriptional regulator, lower aerobic nicotinate degradation pathway regulator